MVALLGTQVYGDGRLLHGCTIPVVSGVKPASHKVLVSIQGVQRLDLRVALVGSATNVSPIWVDPRVRVAPWVFDQLEVR